MDENQTSAPKSTLTPAKRIGQLVAAMILAEGIWGLLTSLTSNLLVPLLARAMDADPQSPSYLEIRPGLPWGRLVGGPADRSPICTKAGGLGNPEAICPAVNFLAAQPRFQETK